MSVRRDKRGRLTVDVLFRYADGSERRVTRASAKWTKRDAEAWERDARRRLADGTYDHAKEEVARETPTLQSCVDDRSLPVYPAAAGNRPSTLTARQWALGHVLPTLGPLRLDEVGTEAVATLSAALAGKNLAPKSIKDILGTLRRVLATAQEWGVIDRLPRFPRRTGADRSALLHQFGSPEVHPEGGHGKGGLR